MIVCVGGETHAWMTAFREHAERHGFHAFCFPLASSLTGAVSRLPFGVIVFDAGEDHAPARLRRIRECTRYLDVPIVAVSVGGDRNAHARLLAAGAHQHLTTVASPGEVLDALAQRADVQPVLSDIQTNLLMPFMEVTQMTFREMAHVELNIRASYQKKTYRMFGDISAVLGLFGRGEGAMVLSFPQATAVALTRAIFPGFPVEDDAEMVKDCVAEIANIIAGQTKGRLAGTLHAFNISTPTVVSGTEHVIQHKAGMPSLVVVFQGPLGEFVLQICLSLS